MEATVSNWLLPAVVGLSSARSHELGLGPVAVQQQDGASTFLFIGPSGKKHLSMLVERKGCCMSRLHHGCIPLKMSLSKRVNGRAGACPRRVTRGPAYTGLLI